MNLLKDIPNPAKYQPSAIEDVCPQSLDLINIVGSTWQRWSVPFERPNKAAKA